MLPQIHWKQGLFLQPHHFQRLQRTFDELGIEARRLAFPYPYGVIQLEARLGDKDITLSRLRAILQEEGVEINFGDTPRSRDNAVVPSLKIVEAIKKYPNGFVVSLALPRWSDHSANQASSESNRDLENRKFWVKKESAPDENVVGDAREVEVRFLNARLVVEDDPRSGDITTLPLLRVLIKKEKGNPAAEPVPELDPDFVPPCLVLTASERLLKLIRPVRDNIVREREKAIKALAAGREIEWEGVRGAQLERVLRLRSLNRFANLASCLLNAWSMRITAPFVLFTAMCELLGELSALQPQNDTKLRIPEYNHDDQFKCFSDLCEKLAMTIVEPKAPKVHTGIFEEGQRDLGANGRVFLLNLDDVMLKSAGTFYLGVKLHGVRSEIEECVMDGDRFKFMSPGTVWDPEYGVCLRLEDEPEGLEPKRDIYFAVLPDSARDDSKFSNNRWADIQREKAVALWLGPGFNWGGVEFVLYKRLE